MEICNNPQLCCGCSACQSACPLSAITVIEDNRGFYRPNVDETKCVQCGLCEATCPANGGMAEELKRGPLEVLAYKGTDQERAKSSSGAAFWALVQCAWQGRRSVWRLFRRRVPRCAETLRH